MKTIYLHVGNFKTGTSAIQKFCSDHRKELLDSGFDYLPGARPSRNTVSHGKIPVSLIMKYGGHVPSWYIDTDSFSDVCAAVVTQIDSSKCDNIILSSEEFYRIASYKNSTIKSAIADLRELFSGHQVKVIMYVREPLPFSKSWYNQANKANIPLRRFTDFFYYLNKSLLLPQNNARFWRDCFGSDCLIIEAYGLSGTNHIRRFLDLIAADPSLAIQASDSLINAKRNEKTLELDRISRIMLLKDVNEREIYLNSFVLKNAANTQKLQDKIDFINREFVNFCREEGLTFRNASFGLADLMDYEKTINRKDASSPNIFRRKLAQIRNSNLTHIVKKTW